MAFVEPLNLENILITTLSGNTLIFTFLAIITISALAARFRMPNVVFGIMLAIFSILLNPYIGGLYLIAVVVGGFLTFNAIADRFN